MKFLLACLLLLCTSCALFKEKPVTVKPSARGNGWWTKRHKEKLAQKEKMGTVDLIFLGDSIIHFWENRGSSVWEKYYSKRNTLNLGFSGDRTEHVLWRLNNGAVDGINPKLLILMIGTNNTGHRKDKSADTAKGIEAILETLEKKLPKTKILLLAVFPRGAKPGDKMRRLNDGINEIIKDFHDGKRVHYLSINNKFLDAEGMMSRKVMKDFLHPNKEQYKVWAEAIEHKVKELMGE